MKEGDRNGSAALLRDILSANFCANGEYSLVLFDRLPPDQQEMLRDLTRDPEFYGVLLPAPGSQRKTKSACQSTALLLYTLSTPGTIPEYVKTSLGERANQAIAEMVLDEVLTIESDSGFVCGSAAYDLLYSEPHIEETARPLANLTRDALEYAQRLAIEDSSMLSGRLYAYNRVPLSARWEQMLPDREATARWLGIDRKGALRPLLDDGWDRVSVTAQNEGWFQWSSRTRRADSAQGTTGYKLYVSPIPEATREAFRVVVETVSESVTQTASATVPASMSGAGAYHFKVGDDGYGLLRPDKIVLYFHDFTALEETGRRLAERLADCPAQGVPFTAALDGSRLLSWGVDPPKQSGVLAWQERESWRLWITNRLATAMIAAQRTENGRLAPWRFALERLRLESIDTDTWTPLPGFGRAAALEATP